MEISILKCRTKLIGKQSLNSAALSFVEEEGNLGLEAPTSPFDVLRAVVNYLEQNTPEMELITGIQIFIGDAVAESEEEPEEEAFEE